MHPDKTHIPADSVTRESVVDHEIQDPKPRQAWVWTERKKAEGDRIDDIVRVDEEEKEQDE